MPEIETQSGAVDVSEGRALALDRADPLRAFREEFQIPTVADVARPAIASSAGSGSGSEPCVYLCGHSLGLMPRAVRGAVEQDLEDWGRLAVEGHFHGARPWYAAQERIRPHLAGLVGALPHEVVAMNSLSVNLHLMMASFYRPRGERRAIVIESGAFPSDSYAAQSQAEWHGLDPKSAVVRLSAREGEAVLRTEDVIETIERRAGSIAVVMLPGVNYLTGQVMDIEAITRAGHRAGAMVGWDLAHSIGNTELRLNEWGPDFACWCSYKYLNAGPGAVGGCFVHERHTRKTGTFGAGDFVPRLAGWWGNDPATRFRMTQDFEPVAAADAWAPSNPPVLALTPVRVSLEMFSHAGMPAIRAKGRALTGYLCGLIGAMRGTRGMVEVMTPRESLERGSQVSLRVRGGARDLLAALIARGVVCDFREPDVIRVAPVPLYTAFRDCWRFVEVMGEGLGNRKQGTG